SPMTSRISWWPASGPIELAKHDLPHAAADTEWWYVNSHVRIADGRTFGVFAAFFRIIEARDEITHMPTYAYSMTSAISDLETKRYVAESRVDHRAPEMGLVRIKNARGVKDERLNRAMAEVLEQNKVPAPDRVFDGAVHVATDRLDLQYGTSSFTKLPDGSYRVTLVNPDEEAGCELVFAPSKQPARHGDDGVVRGNAGEQMFYYFIPRCAVTGTITINGVAHPVTEGQGWYDHEFGGYVAPEAVPTG